MYCANCGKEIDDNADVCIGCGCAVRNVNLQGRASRFCTHCGKEISAQAAVCVNCGCAVNANKTSTDMAKPEDLLNQLSSKVKINAIIWLCIAGIQVILGFAEAWVLLIPGVLNTISAIMDFKYSTEVLEKPEGIVKKFEPLVVPIITLIYNLFLGGVIGVAGSIYYLVAIRNFVLTNRTAFEELEMNASPISDRNNL
ncbi:MAG: zinc ribbon domain-containing protein [Acutalibacteraceae bacterium]